MKYQQNITGILIIPYLYYFPLYKTDSIICLYAAHIELLMTSWLTIDTTILPLQETEEVGLQEGNCCQVLSDKKREAAGGWKNKGNKS